MKLELVKKAGRPALLQELGTKGNQQCLFRSLDPVDYVKKKTGGGGFGNGGFGGGVVPPQPIDFPAPVGLPDQPVLIPAPAMAATPNMAQALAAADGALFLKIRMPIEFEGLHASPYWLSRHTSKAKNRDLHRARAVYFSYFCSEINPDAANFQGGPVQDVPPVLKDYFAEDDKHAKGSQNCFNCHAKVQPLANFFGLLSFGTPYEQTGGFDTWPQYLNAEGSGFNRPGGLFDGQKFFPHPGGNLGMDGLANVLAAYPPVNKCIVDGTWAALVGRDFPLFEDERKGAVSAFAGDGAAAKPSMSRLLKYLLIETKRGPAYFAKGEADFEKIVPDAAFQCPDTPPEDFQAASVKFMEGKCVDCHSDAFFDANGKFSVDAYFPNQAVDDTPQARGSLWQKLYCKTKLEKMPPGGGVDPETRGRLWCWLGRTRDQLAKAGKIPAEFAGKACQGAPPAGMGAPHTVGTGTH